MRFNFFRMNNYAIIFDMDGVLVDSNPYHKIALHQFCAKYGYHLTEEGLRNKIYGRTNKEWITNLFGTLPPDQLAQYGEEKEALYRELFDKDIQPVAGLLDFLHLLNKHKIPRAIGTSAPWSNVDFTLSKTGTQSFFHIILDESHVTHSKPNPEIYINVAKRLGLPPQQCIVFEDSLSGVISAKQAGAKVVGITTTHTPAELSETDLIINDFKNLDPLDLFVKIFK